MSVEQVAWEDRRARFLAGESVWLQDDPRFSGIGVRYEGHSEDDSVLHLTVFDGAGYRVANEVALPLKPSTVRALIALLLETL